MAPLSRCGELMSFLDLCEWVCCASGCTTIGYKTHEGMTVLNNEYRFLVKGRVTQQYLVYLDELNDSFPPSLYSIKGWMLNKELQSPTPICHRAI